MMKHANSLTMTINQAVDLGNAIDDPYLPAKPSLFFVRDRAVFFFTSDGELNKMGGYFGVEPSEYSSPEKVYTPAPQWNEALCGALPPLHLENQLDDDSGYKRKLEQPVKAFHRDSSYHTDSSYRMSKKKSNSIWKASTTQLFLEDEKEEDDELSKSIGSTHLSSVIDELFTYLDEEKDEEKDEEDYVAKLPKKPEPEKPKEPDKKEEEERSVDTNMFMKRRQQRRTSVQSTLKFGDLDMLKFLGDGQFAEVWLVEATVDGKKEKFALKSQIKKDNIKEIEREIAVTQKLTTSHPCIVDLLHTFETEDSIHMLLGLITGGDLWNILYQEDEEGDWTSGIPESQAKFYALVVADTLSYMHAQKYVYRDLKPENVMIGVDGYPVIVDFGFTKQVCKDMTFTFCGTPNYISPEIIKNAGHNAGADHWALGVLIYEMIAGEHPFFVDGMDQMMVFEAICEEKHYPLSTLKEDVSEAAVDLVDELLEKEASQRLGMLAGKEGGILNHKWFKGLDLDQLRSKKAEAPWIPSR
jgi:hypothetical protein